MNDIIQLSANIHFRIHHPNSLTAVETRSTPWDGWDPQVLSHEEKVLRLQVTMADLILVHVVDSTSVDSPEVKAGKHPPTNV